MALSIIPKIDSDPILGPRVRQANKMLKDIIGTTADQVSIHWDLQDANGRRSVYLTLADYTGARLPPAPFRQEDLLNEGILKARFHRLWGDLLQQRSHQQLIQL